MAWARTIGARSVLGLWVALWCVWIAACDPGGEPLSEKARGFRDRQRQILSGVGELVAGPLAADDRFRVRELLAQFIHQPDLAGPSGNFGLAVMDRRGRLVTGLMPIKPDDQVSGISPMPDQNYGSFSNISEVLEKGVCRSFMLYAPEGGLVTICAPVKNDRKVIGAVCVAYPETGLTESQGLSRQEILSMDFGI